MAMRLAMFSNGSIEYFISLPIRALFQWMETALRIDRENKAEQGRD